MSRIILLLIIVVWMVGTENVPPAQTISLRPLLPFFFVGFLVLPAIVGLSARRLTRHLGTPDVFPHLRRFSRRVDLIRWLIPVWLALGFLPWVGWGALVSAATPDRFHFPSMLLGTAPALITWMLLWWAEYPTDRALREQNILEQLDRDLPVRAPPSFRLYVSTLLRQELLPVVLPFFLVLTFRDLMLLSAFTWLNPRNDEWLIIPAGMLVYFLAPEIFRRLLKARPLDDSPLRHRLEELCRASNLRCRDILLWDTNHSMANALVIGVLPRMRYVLLSDRLLETTSDEHIEAVFAHELGHIVHRHLIWFILFFIASTLATMLVQESISAVLPDRFIQYTNETARQVVGNLCIFAGVFLVFGMLIRRFEHQADIFAARTMELLSYGPGSTTSPLTSPVGFRGAGAFNAALERVAFVNNIPTSARDFFHPSIRNRLAYLMRLATNPPETFRFDRGIRLIKLAIILVLLLALLLSYFVPSSARVPEALHAHIIPANVHLHAEHSGADERVVAPARHRHAVGRADHLSPPQAETAGRP